MIWIILMILIILFMLLIVFFAWKYGGIKIAIPTLIILGLIAFFLDTHIFNEKLKSAMEHSDEMNSMNSEIFSLENDVREGEAFTDLYSIETFKLRDGKILIKLFNERDEYVYASCFILFYQNGKKVEIPNQTYLLDIAPHSYSYEIVSVDSDYLNDSIEYPPDEIKVFIKKQYFPFSIPCEKDIEYHVNKDENLVYGINKFDGHIEEIKFDILYYDEDNNIIDYDTHSMYKDIPPAGEFTSKMRISGGNYEVLLKSASCNK